MKIKRKIKRILYSIGLLILTVSVKISYAKNSIEMESLYGVPSVPKEPEIHLGFWDTIQGVIRVFCTIFLFPCIIITGATVFYIKSKCRRVIKLIVVGLVAAIIGAYIGYISSRY
ncbi:MAG: hypothetical protein IJH12_05785 [Clostridia bacterium]|nr:hypothetical protein [Clostridia bacterium]